MKNERTTYRVVWEIDVEADSATEAAQKARGYQLNPDAAVGYFEAIDGEGRRVGVDLDEDTPEERPVTH